MRTVQNACARSGRSCGKIDGVKFGKVDVDRATELAQRYKIYAIPNVCIFKGGELVDRVIGLSEEEDLTTTIKKYVD